MKRTTLYLTALAVFFLAISARAAENDGRSPEMMLVIAQDTLSSLNLRMADIRRSDPDKLDNAWFRSYVKKQNIIEGLTSKMYLGGIEAGIDRIIYDGENNTWYAGLLAGYAQSEDIDTRPAHGGVTGNGRASAISAGLYGEWLHSRGYFSELSFRAFFAVSDMTAYTAGGDGIGYKPKRNILMLTASFGKEMSYNVCKDTALTVEPKLEAVFAYADSDNRHSSKGVPLHLDSTTGLALRPSLLFAYNKTLKSGAVLQPYFEAAYQYEFDSKTDTYYGDKHFVSDLSGGYVSFDIGANWHASDTLSFYTTLDSDRGPHVESYGFNLGARYSFENRFRKQKQK